MGASGFISILYSNQNVQVKVKGVLSLLHIAIWLETKYSGVLLSFQSVEIIKITLITLLTSISPFQFLFIKNQDYSDYYCNQYFALS